MTKQQPSFKHKVTNYGVKGLAFGAMAVVGETIMAAEVLSIAVPCAIIGGTAYGIYHLATKGNK